MRRTTGASGGGPWTRSVSLEVGADLPSRDLLLIALPLHILRLDETFEEVDTQRIAHDLVLPEIFEGLGERGGGGAELVAGEPLGVEGGQVLFNRRGGGGVFAGNRPARGQPSGGREGGGSGRGGGAHN